MQKKVKSTPIRRKYISIQVVRFNISKSIFNALIRLRMFVVFFKFFHVINYFNGSINESKYPNNFKVKSINFQMPSNGRPQSNLKVWVISCQLSVFNNGCQLKLNYKAKKIVDLKKKAKSR